MNGFLALKISDPVMYTLAFVLFIVILIILVLIRRESWRKNGFQNADIILALIPVVFALLITGKIQKFAFAGLEFETVFKEASESKIEDQITLFETSKPEIEEIERAAKGDLSMIPVMIEKKVEALVFRLGYANYAGFAIDAYLTEMLKYQFLRLINIEDEAGQLFGVYNARDFASAVQLPDPPFKYEDFATWLRDSDTISLKRIPGFISIDAALTEEANKRMALERLDSLNVNELPVVSNERRFVGLVDRSRLTASLIIDVARQIE